MAVRSISARFAVIYTTAFALAVVVLGVVIFAATRSVLTQQFEAHIRTESASLIQEFHTEGLSDVVDAVRERDRMPEALDYGLVGADGASLVGVLARPDTPLGWSTRTIPRGHGHDEKVRIFTAAMPDGGRLMIGDDLRRVTVLDGFFIRGFALALIGVTTLGAAGGYLMSRDMRRRLNAMSDVAEAISEGDLSRRMPVRAAADDLDQLAVTFNRMLDRIGALMESVRQVSNDIAHDLRTPLTRLRQKLEAIQTDAPVAERGKLELALADLDAALDTFAALLRIAQIEAGARRGRFTIVDVNAVAQHVVESFSPSAEEGGRTLTFTGARAAQIVGDADLLTQMLVNLVDNSLRHTPVGSHVLVHVMAGGAGVDLVVADDGPGVPRGEQSRIFDRFYRLETSRSTPGSGLGLALVAAVAKLHDGEIALADLTPGLETRISFPRAAAA